jgi:serine/threonine protein kinase
VSDAGRAKPNAETAHTGRANAKTEMVGISLAAHKDHSLAPSSPPAAGPVVPGIGVKVGKCLLLDCIGKGGLGVVYRALHTSLQISVAVKFLRNQSKVGGFLARFRAEARLLAQLNHPNVVRVLDFEDDPEQPYVTMEFVEGLSVHDLLVQTGRILPDRAVVLALQMVSGLEAAWKLGIVHRDIKPANVLVARDGTARLVDFGMAVRLDADQPDGRGPLRPEGTVAYMCPELARYPDQLDHRADIYSLGVTLFQMVTGRLPYQGANSFELMAAHAADPVPDPRGLAPDVPADLAAVIQRMMAKRPDDRFPTYDALRSALRAAARPTLVSL